MDMQVEAAPADTTPVAPQNLTYTWLYQQVQQWSGQSIYPRPSRPEKWAFRIGVLAAAVGLLSAAIPTRLLPVEQATWLAFACLLIEIGGFLVGGLLTAKREWRQYAKPRLSHAEEMDREFDYWGELVASLKRFPTTELEERLRFVTSLRQNMNERMGLMYGGLQKLGPFPVLVALYLQFRNWQWGDWAGAFDVNFVGGLLIFAMVMMYLMGWVLVAVRTRLDTYVSLLEAAIK